MTGHEKIAARNIKNCFNFEIGGMYNAYLDGETDFPTLEEAFADSLQIGEGGTVIMSPACASFGLFKNYKVRGQVFDKLVENV